MVACRQLNLDVPTDIAIVGFDDIALATLVSPALTTIRVRQYDMGRLASELLLERLHGKESPKDHVLYPVELIVRGSSGTQRSNRKQADQTLDYLLNLDFVDPVQCGPDE